MLWGSRCNAWSATRARICYLYTYRTRYISVSSNGFYLILPNSFTRYIKHNLMHVIWTLIDRISVLHYFYEQIPTLLRRHICLLFLCRLFWKVWNYTICDFCHQYRYEFFLFSLEFSCFCHGTKKWGVNFHMITLFKSEKMLENFHDVAVPIFSIFWPILRMNRHTHKHLIFHKHYASKSSCLFISTVDYGRGRVLCCFVTYLD